ncbi:DUF208 domain-containing protein [Campylobacter blaseri]|uniref:Epoxyqueuosine reductase QueH n=1 Tax=Campylobacter blaseri TaxID=2042961 RepID=A0A2P8R129_9BACT|nr:epoxyqueuosine reductase QueH [Campylobacter blaseri]PSM52204.1 diacylglucosamine hydrolase like protein [Campylobacter blaseri]PSM53970.1 diacylglucosamine hydrolase like protein [Campylobacter blaseri]QKF85408.1 DUF208 domain-containing protein [Campylobacter blaseri]
MVVQICCSVDSHYFLKRLKEEYPNEEIIGYFYDPNIHPYSEYLLRYQDVVRSSKKMGINVHLGEYDINSWFLCVKGLENEKERGERCQKCFDFRMDATAKFAKSIGHNLITTTLLMSPKKSYEQLVKSLDEICKEYELEFIAPDYRKKGGTQEQFDLAKKDMLYHQNYCGCIYAMKMQNKESLEYELMSDVLKRALPNSCDDRLSFYKKVENLENEGIKFKILRDKIINYRLLNAKVKFDEKVVRSYFLFNSHFERNLVKFKIDKKCDEFYTNKEQIRILSLVKFNKICGLNYKNLNELYKNPLSIEEELRLREKISFRDSFSPIIIVENIQISSARVEAKSKIYLDVKESLEICKNI